MQLLLRIAATPRNASFARPMALAAFPVAAGFGRQIGFIAIRSALRWSSSNSRWKQRQGGDYYAREAKVKGLKSRAAFKLIEIAVERTKPNGRVVGIDLIPAQPPRGVSTIQGNFLSPVVQNLVKEYLAEMAQRQTAGIEALLENADNNNNEIVITDRPSYIDAERAESVVSSEHVYKQISEDEGRLVDVVLSDMSAPWLQTSGFSSNTLSNPYDRMMNTSGMPFRDHAGSIDLCLAALQFASDTLRGGGHFVCKFYQGAEDKDLEKRLKKMFGKVHWEKPDSSRDESREAYFVALCRKTDVWFSDTEP
ncbi:putative ribosomal rna methyltransferase mrm2 protein [Eutypa lata UCREL1]|uniref:rRNA methyltransferase 2, mitochondrial n=1 Tax=Eutypa lata (strain UCR-EL1) TaxID=1287681 RepID=M7T2M5_EUTLA|nr:putative ribosomal rna methyltransferase mrm2 protein [Eutypa lata UCREL1]